MILRAVILSLGLLSHAALAYELSAPAPNATLTVPIGQSLLLEYVGLTRVSVGNADLVEIEVFEDRDEVLLIGLQPGTTDLRLWDGGDRPERFLLQVHGENGAVTIDADSLKTLLADPAGIDVIQADGEVILRGTARSRQDYERITAMSARYANVTAYVDAPVFDRAPTVALQARMLEVRTSALKDLGVQWDQFIDGPVFGYLEDFKSNPLYRLTTAPDGTQIAGRVAGSRNFGGLSTSVSSTINLLIENGDARLLAEPTLSCISGGTADFIAGGEVPIPVRDENGVPSVEFKEFGIILRFSPLVDDDRYIRTDVQVEVSAVDESISVLDVPGFLTRKSNTLMNLAEGQTMVIAGLVSREDAKNVRKLPLLGQTPILGELFKSREFRKQKSELVILVTPRIIDERSPFNQDYKDRYDQLMKESDKALAYKVRD